MANSIYVTHKDTGATEAVGSHAIQNVSKVPGTPGDPNAKPPCTPTPESAIIYWRNGAPSWPVVETQSAIHDAMNA